MDFFQKLQVQQKIFHPVQFCKKVDNVSTNTKDAIETVSYQ